MGIPAKEMGWVRWHLIRARNFKNCKFQSIRSDGELFFVIANGSAGTAMVPFIPAILTEKEAWHIILYLRTLCLEHRQ
jgi:hypothetical protein